MSFKKNKKVRIESMELTVVGESGRGYLGSTSGKGNGTLLKYSCLENPRDGGAWWAAVFGVAQSWT